MIPIDNLKVLLSEYKQWKLVVIEKDTFGLYVTKEFRKDNYLQGCRQECDVTLYKEVDGRLGSATVTITADDESAVRKQLEEAYEMCDYAVKDMFSLPEPGQERQSVLIADPAILEAIKQGEMEGKLLVHYDVAKEAASKHPGKRMSGMEIIAEYSAITIENSKGLKNNYGKTRVYADITLIAGEGEDEQEYFARGTSSRLEDIEMDDLVEECAQKVEDAVASIRPESQDCDIILTKRATAEFFSPHGPTHPFVAHCAAKLVHLGMSSYEKGEAVFEKTEGDSLTVVSNPLTDWNPASTPCDMDGVASETVLMIDEGKWKELLAPKQYADYLDIKPTGALGVMDLPPGKVSKDELMDDCVEISEFSWFVPNAVSGDFSAEIRLGYIHKDGKKIPFKGGTFAGNMFTVFDNVVFSRELYEEEGYAGPEVVRFKAKHLSGE